MTKQEFLSLLDRDPEMAMRLLFTHAVSEWMNDCEEEVVRVLAAWASRRRTGDPGWPSIEFPSDAAVLEYAQDKGLVDDDRKADVIIMVEKERQ